NGEFNSVVLVAKYDADGNFVWAKSAGSSSSAQGWSVAVDKMDNVFIGGMFNNDATFDDSDLTAFGGDFSDNMFVAKITPENFLAIPTLGQWSLLILSISI